MYGKSSKSECIRLIGEFEDRAISLTDVPANIDELQAVIEKLKKQNAELKANLVGNDWVIHHYHLDGPNEDEI